MHGKSIAWVRDRCTLEGAMRPLLYAVATHADNHYAVCTASAATLARASGVSTRWVKTLLREAVDIGVLEQLYEGRGRKPAAYRIAPVWVEGTVTASAVVEGTVTASGVVEGEISTGPASGEPSSPQRSLEEALGLRSGALLDPVVVHFSDRSGALLPALSSTDGSQDKSFEDKSFEDKNVPHPRSLAGARSDAGQAQAPDAMEPPPVPESLRQHLQERFGPRPKPKPPRPRDTAPPARSAEEQKAELRRRFPEQFVAEEEAKSAKSGEASA